MGILRQMFKPTLSFLFSLLLFILEVNGKKYILKLQDEDKKISSGSDYYIPKPPATAITANIGKPAKLRCESPKDFQGCKFFSPSGEEFNVGIGGGSSYGEKSRVDGWSVEEDIDPTRVCGIYIKKVVAEDSGPWRCELEFGGKGYGGKPIKKTDTQELIVLDPKSNPDVTIKGKYIQRKEVDLKPKNLITVLPNLGSEYKIIFDLKITEMKPKRWLSVIMFTADRGAGGDVKYGERTPAVFVRDDKLNVNGTTKDDPKLHIASAISGNSNHHINVPIKLGEWIKIVISQHVIDNELTFEILINRKSVHKVVQTKPCLYRDVKVFGGQPTAAYKTVTGKIKNLYYETSDNQNKGKCVVDFRTKPLDPSGELCVTEASTDLNGNDVAKLKNIESPQVCACACKDHPECSFYTWSGRGNWCFLKNSDKGRKDSHDQAHSGNKHCCTGFELLQGPELVLKKDQLITVVPYMGKEYEVSFELYLNSYPTADWTSVLHFTRSGNAHSYGDRCPGVWLSGHANHYRLLHVAAAVDGITNMWIDTKKIYPLKTWIKIKISQALMYDNFVYTVEVDGQTVHEEINDVAAMFTDVKVYAGDPWYPAQDGKIRNLTLKTKNDGACVCAAASFCPKGSYGKTPAGSL